MGTVSTVDDLRHLRPTLLPRDDTGAKVVRWVGRAGGRPGRYGNPHRTAEVGPCEVCHRSHDRDEAVALYRAEAEARDDLAEWLAPLAPFEGLACSCPLDLACHADVLLELLDRYWPWPTSAP